MQWLRSHEEVSNFGMKYSREDVVAYDMMTRLVERVNGHYQLPLPWKNDSEVLPDSLPMASGRLEGLKKRLLRNSAMRDKYIENMATLLEKGYAERIPEDQVGTKNRVWYLPHHPVVNPKKPEKVRIVFDCAAKCSGQSINDKLMKGPDLVNNLVGVLARFRKDRVAVVADIEAMFHQVSVAPRDRDALRFLWWPGGDMSKVATPHRMNVHLFGARSSPSCATFCLRETAREHGKFFDPRVADAVRYNFYVDDCLATAPCDSSAIKLVKDLKSLLALGGFKLTKWVSTSDAVMESVPVQERGKACQNVSLGDCVQQRVLGINWDVNEDEFQFSVDLPAKPLTRRGMLSVTNSLFDPLGFVAPVVLEARLMYRNLCQKKLDWDEEVGGADLTKWRKWCGSLERLRAVRIPRCFRPKTTNEITGQQLHFFADASTVARGCVCYLRTTMEDGSAHCSFVMGRSLLSGSGKHTIPRLELEAALDAVKLSRTVKKELCMENCPCVFWSDSTIVLHSLFADSKNFPVFSRNRLSQIEKFTCVHDWRHVPTASNPADQASRGMAADAFVGSKLWQNGPDFLRFPPDQWPKGFAKPEVPGGIYSSFDLKEATNVFLSISDCSPTDKLINHFSSLYRLKIATGWLLRVRGYLHKKTKGETATLSRSPITVIELQDAEKALVQYNQRQEFPNWTKGDLPSHQNKTSQIYKLNPIMVDGVLRVGGRLENCCLDYEAKHPAIIPHQSHFTDLLIEHYHSKKAGHSGVNHTMNLLCQRYWVVNARVAIRRALRKCLLCRRRDANPGSQQMADLPSARLQLNEAPFTHTGVDYFGPFTIKIRRSEVKRYGCLFTCMTSRAIHLEVSPDLSTDAFINAMRRFIARRGPIKHMYSDNGTNFVGAERVLRESVDEWNQQQIHNYLRQKAVTWHFNPPSASHFGGAWERMVRSVRRILMTLLPDKPLDDDLLHTLFLEVEDIVNSRPLTQVQLEVGEELPLTPNHLLKLKPTVGLPPVNTSKTDCYARRRFRAVQYLADEFWRRWMQEYPRTIIARQKWHERKKNFAVNDIVLLVDDSTPRGRWPMGRVLNIFHDKNGIVRSVEVKTSSGVLKRPVAKLCVIVPAETEGDEEETEPRM
uniref:Uncharacterized protein LOC104265735 n=1 Tax=Phallusia mammillata TaxID=59560 RepID=A0A6F9DI71_9ASCI|nr:uncharacterized protein LOC104265735 [Phallusia mammillata]